MSRMQKGRLYFTGFLLLLLLVSQVMTEKWRS